MCGLIKSLEMCTVLYSYLYVEYRYMYMNNSGLRFTVNLCPKSVQQILITVCQWRAHAQYLSPALDFQDTNRRRGRDRMRSVLSPLKL